MNKRLLKWILIGAFATLLMGAAVSCKDYSSDIDNLQSQINSLSTSVSGLQSLIDQGKVVTNVSQSGTGVTITFSDGTSVTIYNGQDGADGKDGVDGNDGNDGNDGKDADVWTIGEDGYWYLNGTKTDYKAIGSDGTTPTIEISSDGYWVINGTKTDVKAKGEDGKDGEDGASYVLIPCDGSDDADVDDYDGWFNLYEVTYDETGETYTYKEVQHHYYQYAPTPTDHITAIWDGNTLTLYNVQDEDGNYTTVTIFLGAELNSIAVVPSVLDSKTYYPTTDAPFLNLTTWYSDEANTEDDEFYYTTSGTTGEWVPQNTPKTDENGDAVQDEDGNTVYDPFIVTTSKIVYRLNPGNAYVEGANYTFINRSVTTRAADGDKGDLLEVVGDPVHNGETVTVEARLADGAVTASDDPERLDFAALRMWVGSDPDNVYTSDYIVVQGIAGDANTVIVNEPASEKTDGVVTFHTRTTSLQYDSAYGDTYATTGSESSEFIKVITNIDSTYTSVLTSRYTAKVTENDLAVDYTTGIDLSEYVNTAAIYDQKDEDNDDVVDSYSYAYLTACGVDVEYVYTLPDHYYIFEGLTSTEISLENHFEDYDQQSCITLSADGKVTVTEGASAYGKHPVVRVDAYYNGKLLASSYIQLVITGPELGTTSINLNELCNNGEAYVIHYRSIQTDYAASGSLQEYDEDLFCGLTYEELMAEAAKDAGIDFEDDIFNFIEYYQYSPLPHVDIYARTDENAWHDHYYDDGTWYGKDDDFSTDDEDEEPTAAQSYYHGSMESIFKSYGVKYKQEAGIVVEMNFPAALADDENFVSLGVDDTLKTQHTYWDSPCSDEAGDYVGAEYYVVVTIKSNDTHVAPDLQIYVHLYCVDDCVAFELNEAYQITETTQNKLSDYGLEDVPAVLVKGEMSGSTYKLTTDVTEHFDNKDSGYNVFQFHRIDTTGALGNVKNIRFDWAEKYDNVTPAYQNGVTNRNIVNGTSTVGISGELVDPYEVKGMHYTQVLDNGEQCVNTYYLVFVNPFKAKASPTSGLKLDDEAGPNYAYAATQIAVVTNDGNSTAILTGSSSSSSPYYSIKIESAASSYGITTSSDYSISYMIDTESGDWAYLEKLVSASGSTLEIDPSTGVITWENKGSKLMYSYTFNVIATVTIPDLSEITFTIPVTLNSTYPAYTGGAGDAN